MTIGQKWFYGVQTIHYIVVLSIDIFFWGKGEEPHSGGRVYGKIWIGDKYWRKILVICNLQHL